MELWDVYSAEGRLTGRTVVRGGNTLRAGEYHLVVHIWPLNDYGSILIQKRTKTKKLMPGMWAATGGAAMAGETSERAARRELGEELGIIAKEVKMLTEEHDLTTIKASNEIILKAFESAVIKF